MSLKVPIALNYKGVCLQNTSKSHSYHLKYGDYYDFMDRPVMVQFLTVPVNDS